MIEISPEVETADRSSVAIKRVLCPVDFSETSRHAIEHAVAIAG
jgi:hypothetical protein